MRIATAGLVGMLMVVGAASHAQDAAPASTNFQANLETWETELRAARMAAVDAQQAVAARRAALLESDPKLAERMAAITRLEQQLEEARKALDEALAADPEMAALLKTAEEKVAASRQARSDVIERIRAHRHGEDQQVEMPANE